MESFHQTIKNTLHFIAVIQDACDKKRLLIEKQNKQGYDAFVKEWKNGKYINPPKKLEVAPVKKEQAEAALLEEDSEELALVDSLLEKARNIRLKTKNALKKSENSTKSSSHGTQLSNNIFKSSAMESQKQKILPKRTDEPNFHKRPVPRSKSASISTKLKTPTVPRSKSANIRHAPNGNEKAHSQRITSKPVHASNGTINVQNTAILSNIELDEYKNMSSGQKVCKTKSQEKIQSAEGLQSPLKSDVKQYPDQQILFPTYRKFLRESQRISISKSSFRVQSRGLWYPFLNLKSKKYLLDQPNFATLDGFTKAVKLIHQIQEAMLWIDLFSLIGRDAIPKLHLLDNGDWNAIRLCSYLESIYNENLQRMPVLDPN